MIIRNLHFLEVYVKNQLIHVRGTVRSTVAPDAQARRRFELSSTSEVPRAGDSGVQSSSDVPARRYETIEEQSVRVRVLTVRVTVFLRA